MRRNRCIGIRRGNQARKRLHFRFLPATSSLQPGYSRVYPLQMVDWKFLGINPFIDSADCDFSLDIICDEAALANPTRTNTSIDPDEFVLATFTE